MDQLYDFKWRSIFQFMEISEILKGTEKDVVLRGWLHNKRPSGALQFLIMRDGSGIIQCLVRKDSFDPEQYEQIENLPVESVLELTGTVLRDSRAPGGFEMQARKVKVLHRSADGYPLTRKYHGPDFLLNNRHFWLRSEKMRAILKIRARIFEAAHSWLRSKGFTEVQMPTLVSSAVEGGATLFEVKYFDTKAYLTQSWQLYAEAAIAALGRIYTIAPSFRAERSRTKKHLTEYWHLEVESPWYTLDDIVRTQEELVSHLCRVVAQESAIELGVLGREPEYLLKIEPPFDRITYDQAIAILERAGLNVQLGQDIGSDEEKVLSEKFKKPVFITHYPTKIRAFYHMPDPMRPEVTLSADLLAPEGRYELSTGGERIYDKELLIRRINEAGLNEKEYAWYVDLRRYGTVPHAGFGLGIERFIAWICKLDHVRNAIAFPRLINRIYP